MPTNQDQAPQDTKAGTSTNSKTKKEKTNDLFDAEAAGIIHTLKDKNQESFKEEEIPDLIDNPSTFNMAVGQAQMRARKNGGGTPHLFVTERLMNYLAGGDPEIKSITYGNPGVRVYLQDSKEHLDWLESLSSDAFHNEVIRKSRK